MKHTRARLAVLAIAVCCVCAAPVRATTLAGRTALDFILSQVGVEVAADEREREAAALFVDIGYQAGGNTVAYDSSACLAQAIFRLRGTR